MSNKALNYLLLYLLLNLIVIYVYLFTQQPNCFLYTDYGKFYQADHFALLHHNIYSGIYMVLKHTAQATAAKPLIQRLGNSLNPPFFQWLLLPLSLLNYKTSLLIWILISAAAGIISIKLLPIPQNATTTLALILALFAYYPTFANIQFAQVSLLLLPILTGAWVTIRKQHFLFGALLLGFASSIKPFFGIFLLYFIIQRQWYATCLFIITLCGLSLIPSINFGFHVYQDYYSSLRAVNWYASNWNAALYGNLLRIFGGREEPNIALFFHPQLTLVLYYSLSVFLVLLLYKFLTTPTLLNFAEKTDYDFALLLIISLLLSPFAWFYYFSWLIIPFTILFRQAMRIHSLYLLIATGVALLLSTIPLDIYDSIGITSENHWCITLSSSVYLASLLLIAGLLWQQKLLVNGICSKPTPLPIDSDKLILVISIALGPGIGGLLNTINAVTLFGEKFVPLYSRIFFSG